jgi:hypothetical protein
MEGGGSRIVDPFLLSFHNLTKISLGTDFSIMLNSNGKVSTIGVNKVKNFIYQIVWTAWSG